MKKHMKVNKMSEQTAFILQLKSPLIGKLDSIKLFGAITSALSELDPQKMEFFLKSFEENKLRISSLFPVVPDKEGHRYYLPMPKIDFRVDPNIFNDIEENKRKEQFGLLKKIKKIKYVSKEIFEELINNRYYIRNLLEKLDKDTGVWKIEKKIENRYLLNKTETAPVIKETEVPRNMLNRYTGRSEIFYSAASVYENCNIFFLARGDEHLINIIESAIKFLQDRGFGQDSSTGYGTFKYTKKEKLDIEEPESSCCITLSLFYPKEAEISKTKKIYTIREIKGITKDGKHIPAVVFIDEGSYFEKEEVNGTKYVVPKTVNILSGYAYPIKIVKCD